MASKKHQTNIKAERIAGYKGLEKKPGRKKRSRGKRVAGK